MKKVTLLFAIILIASSLFGQQTDLKLTVLEINEGQTIIEDQPFKLRLAFENVGTDPILTTDRLSFAFTIDNQVLLSSITTLQHNGIAVGQTIFFENKNFVLPVTDNSLYGKDRSLCGGMILIRDGEDADTLNANNRSCHTVDIFEKNATSVSELVKEQKMQLYPNPATNTITVNMDTYVGTYELKIFSLTGQLVKHEIVNSGVQPISVANLKNGVYMVRAVNKEQQVLSTSRLVISK